MEESRTWDIHWGVLQTQWSHSKGEPTCATGGRAGEVSKWSTDDAIRRPRCLAWSGRSWYLPCWILVCLWSHLLCLLSSIPFWNGDIYFVSLCMRGSTLHTPRTFKFSFLIFWDYTCIISPFPFLILSLPMDPRCSLTNSWPLFI